MVAFPLSGRKESEEWAKEVWYEACMREGKIKPTVQSSYGFDTSRASDSIGRNARHAQALLSRMTFIYRDLNFGGSPQYPYRHPIIQKVVNLTWFQNKDDVGIAFYDYFEPIPIEAITIALTVIECCIDEWSDGTWKESTWSEERYKAIYYSHRESLRNFRNHILDGQLEQGSNLLEQIQCDLLKEARYVSRSVYRGHSFLTRSLPHPKHTRGCPTRSYKGRGSRKAP
ncbi:hypothetical protein BJV77DRAFT_1034682 [Russula vinacea]|nr:hypothetical protein BJV77DRAFT_1034682 [Russula vinacea]